MYKTFLFLLLIICSIQLVAAPFSYLPYTITQPDGEQINCFVSGDEFYNWIHDIDGFTIIQAKDGYFYYADKKDGDIVASGFRVNSVNPGTRGLKAWTKISKSDYNKKVKRFEVPELKSSRLLKSAHIGTLNNLAIYIRFSDDDEIEKTRENYDNLLNSQNTASLKSYYSEVSYNRLNINTTHYPSCPDPSTSNLSYRDSHTRNYFKKYNAGSNPEGYQNDNEASQREHQLLADAITWINSHYPVASGLNIDSDNDGNVDNVCFMIKGNSEGWSDLLWAHRWSLFSNVVYINGKRVWDYTFQPENQVTVRTLCHEMFHSLGAPDLYHYDDNFSTFDPVGNWDVMYSGSGHMGAYMKWKYAGGEWIESIPEITQYGTYTLNPLSSSTNNCYKISSPNSNKEFFIVEYRKKEGKYESTLPGSGLLVYRINSEFTGNANFDDISTFDEVYVYRPGGTVTENGIVANAFYSSNSGRTAINDINSNPKSFLHNNLPGGLEISNITSAGTTISFDVYISPVKAIKDFKTTGISETRIDLSWSLNEDNNDVMVVFSTSEEIGAPVKGINYSVGSQIPGGGQVIYNGNATQFSQTGLIPGINYFYKIWSKTSTNEYSSGITSMTSTYCTNVQIPYEHGFNESQISPCWTVDHVETGNTEDEEASITQVENGTYPEATPFEGSRMIKFNSTYCGAGNKMRLVSPEFSSTTQESILVSFAWHKDTQWPDLIDYMTVQWTIDGINWHDGDTYERYSTVKGWTEQEYTLPVEALGHENVKIGFLFTSLYGYNCYLDKVKIQSIPGDPLDIEAVAQSVSRIDLSWQLNLNNNDVLVAYSLDNVIGNPENGIQYHAGNQINGGGQVIYSGNATSFNHIDLTGGTNYYYKIWSKNTSNVYSKGVLISGSTNCEVPLIPIIQGFNSVDLNPCWQTELVEQGETKEEPPTISMVQSGKYPSCSPNEGSYMVKFNSNKCGAGNKIQLISPAFSTVNQTQLFVNFAWYMCSQMSSKNDQMVIQWSKDGTNWNQGITVTRYRTSSGWTNQVYALPVEAFGQQNLKIGFLFISENGYNCYLDKVRIMTENVSGIKDIKQQQMVVYPNPSKGLFHLQLNKSFNYLEVEVQDISGKIVYSKNHKNNENTIDLSKMPKGIYILTIKADSEYFRQKIVTE